MNDFFADCARNIYEFSGSGSVQEQHLDNPVQVVLFRYCNHPSVITLNENG